MEIEEQWECWALFCAMETKASRYRRLQGKTPGDLCDHCVFASCCPECRWRGGGESHEAWESWKGKTITRTKAKKCSVSCSLLSRKWLVLFFTEAHIASPTGNQHTYQVIRTGKNDNKNHTRYVIWSSCNLLTMISTVVIVWNRMPSLLLFLSHNPNKKLEQYYTTQIMDGCTNAGTHFQYIYAYTSEQMSTVNIHIYLPPACPTWAAASGDLEEVLAHIYNVYLVPGTRVDYCIHIPGT